MRAAAKILPEKVFQTATVVIFGRDGKKARGSWFSADCQAAAHAAAEAMGMNALDVANDDVRHLATKLPQGRVFESGRAFVPFIQSATLDALANHLPQGEHLKVMASGGGAGSADASVVKPVVKPRHHPKNWDDIKVGSLVLACEVEKEGWFECVVQSVSNGQVCLRWLDFPGYEDFYRTPERVALLWAPPTLSDKA